MSQTNSGSRTSRRSNTNLHHLSLAPLSTNRLTVDSDDSDGGDLTFGHQSYIAGKSAPTTPGVLSRSNSRAPPQPHSRGNSHSYTHFAFADEGYAGLEKSKSTGVLLAAGLASVKKKQQQQQRRHAGAASRFANNGPLTAAVDGGSEWLVRAGAALTSEARESKGQSWLTTRASSTSLVALDDEGGIRYGRRSMDDEHALASTRASRTTSRVGSRPGSRMGSRVNSARPSRRGSRSEGNRPELGFMTPTRGGASRTDYFGSAMTGSSGGAASQYAGPDFVDPEDGFDADDDAEEDEELANRLAAKVEEEEIARLAKDRRFGLGGLVDQLLSSTLFSVREDGEDTEGEDEDAAWEAAVAREGQARRIRGEHERVRPSVRESTALTGKDNMQEQGGWRDAAWLLSIATKVMF